VYFYFCKITGFLNEIKFSTRLSKLHQKLSLWHSDVTTFQSHYSLQAASCECVLLKRHWPALISHQGAMSIPRVWEPGGRVGTHFMLLTVIKIGVCVWKEIKTSAACSKCIINSTAPPTDAQRAHTTRKNPPPAHPQQRYIQSLPGEEFAEQRMLTFILIYGWVFARALSYLKLK